MQVAGITSAHAKSYEQVVAFVALFGAEILEHEAPPGEPVKTFTPVGSTGWGKDQISWVTIVNTKVGKERPTLRQSLTVGTTLCRFSSQAMACVSYTWWNIYPTRCVGLVSQRVPWSINSLPCRARSMLADRATTSVATSSRPTTASFHMAQVCSSPVGFSWAWAGECYRLAEYRPQEVFTFTLRPSVANWKSFACSKLLSCWYNLNAHRSYAKYMVPK